jgi:hypothetical protein
MFLQELVQEILLLYVCFITHYLFHVKHAIASVATGCLHTGMTEASGKDSEGVPKGQMTVAQFLEMTAEDRKVVR